MMNAIKARIKRIARHNEDYEQHLLDRGFMPGSFMEFPTLKKGFTFGFSRLGKGYWQTTSIHEIFWEKDHIDFITTNSVYRLLPGWE